MDAVLGERDPIDVAAGLLEECRGGGTDWANKDASASTIAIGIR